MSATGEVYINTYKSGPSTEPEYLQLLHREKDVRGAHSLLPFKFNRENRGIVLKKTMKQWLEGFFFIFVFFFAFLQSCDTGKKDIRVFSTDRVERMTICF